MTFEEIQTGLLTALQEAAKVLHMDQSHGAIRDKLQAKLAGDHRAKHPDGDYYSYPRVMDTYGNESEGSVVHISNGSHTLSKYKADGDGVTLSDHKKVKPAYVTVTDGHKESAVVYLDGAEFEPLAAKESATIEENIDLRESCFGEDCYGTIKMIAPGHGATGYYPADVLKEAVAAGVFDNAQMFIDHATDEEDANRPEGTVLKLAAKGGKATYKEAGPDGPGVYTVAKVYADVKDFLNARAKDIGVSIRAGGVAEKTARMIEGRLNKMVKSVNVMRSTDFVTRAGAGGKLVSLLESYRESNPTNKEKDMKIEIEETELKNLRESTGKIPALQLQIDRSNARFAILDAERFATSELKESGLPVPAQNRLLRMVTSESYSLPLKDGNLDTAKFKEALGKLVTEEAAYLKESGSGLKLITGMGDANRQPTKEELELKESDVKLGGELDSLIGNLSGAKKKTA